MCPDTETLTDTPKQVHPMCVSQVSCREEERVTCRVKIIICVLAFVRQSERSTWKTWPVTDAHISQLPDMVACGARGHRSVFSLSR